MDRRPLKTREKRWVSKLTKLLIDANIKPDHISMMGIFFAILAGVSLYASNFSGSKWHFLSAAIFIQLRLLCNMMDGMVAVEGKLKSKLGDVFNEIPDRYEDLFFLHVLVLRQSM